MLTLLQGINSESPCSPITYACTFLGLIFSRSPIKKRKRAVSKLVPVPIIWLVSKPEYFQVK